MPSQKTTLCNKLGLHARAAMKLTDKAMAYESNIQLKQDQRQVDAKSIMEVMVLGAVYGQEVEIITTGPDEQEALQGIIELIENRFGESE